VILLFFDPDKPGTTGETLDCLTTSLAASEHKLHIIMNKVDQFVHIHDFARAYGSLCWNLAKVIRRKDLPPVYTMYLPPSALKDRPHGHAAAEAAPLARALAELEGTRDEVLRAVHRAPERRIDNLITAAYDEASVLRMHALIAAEARNTYVNARNRFAALGSALAVSGPLAGTYVWLEVDSSLQACVGIGALGLGAAALVGLRARAVLGELTARTLSDDGMDDLFRGCYRVEVEAKDEAVASLWRRVRPQMQRSLRTLSLAGVPRLHPAKLSELDDVLRAQVPELRRLASPRNTQLRSAEPATPPPPLPPPRPQPPKSRPEGAAGAE